MATVLFTWELGGGLGHVMPMSSLAAGLAERGHQIVITLRDLLGGQAAFQGIQATFLQAPLRTLRAKNFISVTHTLADVLHNTAFDDDARLQIMADAWRAIYNYVQPDLVVFDYSPTAMLAAQGYRFKRAAFGTGFTCPPAEGPLPDWNPRSNYDAAHLLFDERRVTDVANRVLEQWHLPPLGRITDLWARCDESFLATFRELDHAGPRGDVRYWGIWSNVPCQPAVWPNGNGPRRVFAYVKPSLALEALFEILVKWELPTLVCANQLDPSLARHFVGSTLRFESKPLDMAQIARECDVAIVNATHGTTAEILLAGKPLLLLPLVLEQQVTARKVVELGAGLAAGSKDGVQAVKSLKQVLEVDGFRLAAERFAAQYTGFNRQEQLQAVVERLDGLVRM
jgi:UDP-N-acetylglucosamine:LPS N-acetylglucosamine transferase